MHALLKSIFLPLIFSCALNILFAQSKSNFLRRVNDRTKHRYGYVDSKGDTVIPIGKYDFCFTEKFYKFAIVSLPGKGIVGIDRKENILFNIYIIDNGPDYPSNGLFRIVKGNKIGYADLNGNIIIKPQFDCAYPFKKGKAEVGKGCKTQINGEYHSWIGGKWHIIDKKGHRIKK